MHDEYEGGDEGDEYEYFEVEEETELARKAYAKRQIRDAKDTPGFLKRPDYTSNISKGSEPEYRPPEKEEEKEAPPKKEKKKEEYEL